MSFVKKFWQIIKATSETIGIIIIIIDFTVYVLFYVISAFNSHSINAGTTSTFIGFLSVALGFIAIGMSEKAEKNNWILLTLLSQQISDLPHILRQDTIDNIKLDKITSPVCTPNTIIKSTDAQKSMRVDVLQQFDSYYQQKLKGLYTKEAAQTRLDNDTKRIGYQRGELYKTDDGSWAIHWGGKYRL